MAVHECSTDIQNRHCKSCGVSVGRRKSYCLNCHKSLRKEQSRISHQNNRTPIKRISAVRNCKICGKEFDAYLTVINGKKSYIVCSYKCFRLHRRNIQIKGGRVKDIFIPNTEVRTCKLCKSKFIAKSYQQVYCSTSCSYKNDNKLRRCRRYSNARNDGLSHELVDVGYIFERDKWKCGLCGKKVNKELKYPHPKSASLDHIVPLAKGGVHCHANVQLAHFDCNHRKRTQSKGEQLLLIG